MGNGLTSLVEFGSAPCSRSSITQAVCPPAAARIRGVVESYVWESEMIKYNGLIFLITSLKKSIHKKNKIL